MGFHWKHLGYTSLQEFINAMYQNEAGQIDAMCRFIQKNNLIQPLRDQQWAKFAKGYNGSGYKANQYDKKLAKAYQKFKDKS